MTIEKAQEISKLLDERETLEIAVGRLTDFLKVRVEICLDNPSPSSVWVREYIGEFMTSDVVRRMKERVAEIDKLIGEM